MGKFWQGAAAGAAGTTALNAVTYVDMAIRGRGTSDSPQQVVEKTADAVGVEVPGKGDTYDNRVSGLGPLTGSAVGVGVGVLAGLFDQVTGRRVPAVLLSVATGAAAMLLTDLPMRVLGISDPLDWAAKDWAADAVPHLAYGAVTVATLRSQDGE